MSDFTTTTNLSLKKPAIGGSSDKWGEYLNENMETIGTSIVNLQNASTSRSLESLSNVLDTTPTTGQLLQYDTANWKAATVTIPDNIQDLTNVTISSPADGQVLAYSTSNSRWENQTPGAATIPDGTITSAKLSTSLQGQVALILQTTGTPTDNQILRYDSTSTNWQFEDLPGGTVAALSDTDVSAIANKDVLVYNSTSGNWVSRPLAIADVTNLQTSLDAKLESSDISVSALSDTTITSTVDDSFLVYDSADSKWKNEGPSTVRSTLSLVVGTNVQAYDADLTALGGLAKTDGNFIVGNGTTWTVESGSTARASLGVTIGSQVQAWDQQLDDISALAVTDGNIIVGNGTTWVAESGATARESLGLTIGTDVQAYDADTAKYDDTTANFTGTLQNGGSNVVVDSDIGSSVQAYDADTAKYDDTTANFTGTLQNGGSNVVVDSDIGSSVQGYDADTAKYDDTTANFTGTLQNGGSNVVVDSDIGSTVQAYDADLSTIAGLSSADGNFIVGSATGWVVESGATVRTSLGLGTAATTAATDYATSAQGTTADNALQDLVDDTSPQLGGNLDVNGNSIVSASNGNISITPNGTGNVSLGNFTFDADQTVGVGQDNYVLTYDHSTTSISLEAATGGGGISDIVSDTTPQLGGNLDVNGNSIVSVAAGNIAITPDTTGKIILDGLSWPTADGTTDQVLKTDGAGNLSFVDPSAGGAYGDSDVLDLFNSTGSAPVYACRAWVNFRGVSQSGTLNTSGPVTGLYTVTVTGARTFTIEYSGTTYTVTTSGDHEVGDGEGVDLTISGTTVTIDTQIRASGNVSSITDIGTGEYQVNYAADMPDANYAATVGSIKTDTLGGRGSVTGTYAYTESSVRLVCVRCTTAALEDTLFVSLSVYR